MHLVRDYYYRLAGIAHIAQNCKELIRLLRSENRSRFIEDQYIRAAIENLYDLNSLLLRNTHLVYMLIGIHVKAVSVAYLADLLCGRLEVELSLAFKAEDYVLRGREHVNELEVLMDHADAEIQSVLRRADDNFLIVNENFALVWEINTREHVHQGGLSRAVFAQKRKYLASVYIEPNLVVSFYRAE